MAKLLVSVRSTAEADTAFAAGVDLVDVKEPGRGALGAADPETLASIAQAAPIAAPLSAALGELRDWMTDDGRLHLAALEAHSELLPGNLRYAKLGLAGMAHRPDWADVWHAAVERLPGHVTPVAVAYADALLAAAPSAEDVWRVGRKIGCGALLVDTFCKLGEGLLEWLDVDQLRPLRRMTQADGALLALAGSLTPPAIVKALAVGPDYIAVRGAACAAGAGRMGPVEGQRIAGLMRLVHGPAPVA